MVHGKNRVHLDLRTRDLEAEVSRLLALGATSPDRPRIPVPCVLAALRPDRGPVSSPSVLAWAQAARGPVDEPSKNLTECSVKHCARRARCARLNVHEARRPRVNVHAPGHAFAGRRPAARPVTRAGPHLSRITAR